LFRTAPDGLTPAVVVAAAALVDVATIGILQERAVRQQEVVAGQLQRALNSRVIIEQAKGVLAERLRVTPGEAFVLLRRYVRDHNHPLTELSRDVIRGTAHIAGGR
jgi:AmiR/NasT family two-component response regulator